MQLLAVPVTIPEKIEHLLRPVVSFQTAEAAGSASDWDRVEEQVTEWEGNPSELEDDGIELPDHETAPLIREVGRAMRDLGVESPSRVVPNCESGAVFEWRSAGFLWSVEVERDVALELSVFRSGRLVTRYRLS